MEVEVLNWADWRKRAEEALPAFRKDDRVMISVAKLLEAARDSELDGSAAAVAGILSDAAGLAVWASLPDMEHGDVSPERDFHSWVRDVVETFTSSGAVVDTVPTHAPAPDAMEGSRHNVKRGRNKRGTTALVTGFGSAHVIGSFDLDVNGALTPERLSRTAEILNVKRGAYGVSAIDVQRVTRLSYERTGEIPALLSTDVRQHEQVIHAGNGATDEYGIARANVRDLFGAAGLTDDRSVGSISYPYRGRGLTYGIPSANVADRGKLASWLATYRDADATSAARVASTCDVQTFVPSLKTWTAREIVKRGRARKDDPTTRRVSLFDSYGMVAATMFNVHPRYRWEIVAACDGTAQHRTVEIIGHRPIWNGGPQYELRTRQSVRTGPAARIFVGHRCLARTAPKHGTVNEEGKRPRQARIKRTVGPTFVAETRSALLARIATLESGERLTWTCGPLHGTYTYSPNRRCNIGIRWGTDGKRDASRRTLTALDRILERCEYLATAAA